MNLSDIATMFARQKDINGQLLHKLRTMRTKLIEPNKIEFIDSLIEATVASNNTLTEMRKYIEEQSKRSLGLRTDIERLRSEKAVLVGVVGRLNVKI